MSPFSSEDISLGILTDLLSKFANDALHEKTYTLCVDGKKINASLTNKHGDIDLWGYEQKPTLGERQTELNKNLDRIDACRKQVAKRIEFGQSKVAVVCVDEKTFLANSLI